MPSVSQADLAFTAQILYPTFRTYGNSFQETYRDMHVISRNGSLPLSEKPQALFILISLFLLFYLDFLLPPCPASAASRQPSLLHPRRVKTRWRLWVGAKEKKQCSLIQVASRDAVLRSRCRWQMLLGGSHADRAFLMKYYGKTGLIT